MVPGAEFPGILPKSKQSEAYSAGLLPAGPKTNPASQVRNIPHRRDRQPPLPQPTTPPPTPPSEWAIAPASRFPPPRKRNNARLAQSGAVFIGERPIPAGHGVFFLAYYYGSDCNAYLNLNHPCRFVLCFFRANLPFVPSRLSATSATTQHAVSSDPPDARAGAGCLAPQQITSETLQ